MGVVALILARQRRPGLIILDLMLPKPNGLIVCRELRQESDVPILIVSAKREKVDRLLGFSLAADDYVVKPSPETLRMLHAEVLRRVKLSESLLALARADAIDGRDLHSESVSLRSYIRALLPGGQIEVTRTWWRGNRSIDRQTAGSGSWRASRRIQC